MAKHLIRVEATRRIKQPLYGPHAFSRDTKTIEIPFGKNETIKTSASAMAKAQELANSLLKDASSVSIWRICGGSGTGEYLKDDETKFETGWNENETPTKTEAVIDPSALVAVSVHLKRVGR